MIYNDIYVFFTLTHTCIERHMRPAHSIIASAFFLLITLNPSPSRQTHRGPSIGITRVVTVAVVHGNAVGVTRGAKIVGAARGGELDREPEAKN